MNAETVKKFAGDDDYYAEVMTKDFSWNWGAFFLGAFWLAYRKMYLFTLLYIVIIAAIYSIVPSGYVTGIAVTIITAIILGAFGNKLYLTHAENKIKRGKLGGTNVFAPIILMLSPFIIGLLVQNVFPESGIFPISLG